MNDDEGTDDYPYDDISDEEIVQALMERLEALTRIEAIDALGPSVVLFDGDIASLSGEDEIRAPIRFGQPMCVACGYSVFECIDHNEDDLKIIADHKAGIHERCDLDACPPEGRDK